MAREFSVSVRGKQNESLIESGQYRLGLRTEAESQSLKTNSAVDMRKHMTIYGQSVSNDCSTSDVTAVSSSRAPQCQSTSGHDLVLYNQMSQYSGAVPSYCEVMCDGEVHTSVAPSAALQTCASTASVESCAKSDTTSSSLGPLCRICDSSDRYNRLISPCRCSGTSKFVHEQCLNKWLETINAQQAPRCEVCQYRMRTHKAYRLRNWRMPEVTNCDLILHLIFAAAFSVLIISVAFTMIGFVSNHSKMATRRAGDVLSAEETVVLIGSLMFFIAFIIALLTQIRASQTIYHFLSACVTVNTEWRIEQYHRSNDSFYSKKING